MTDTTKLQFLVGSTNDGETVYGDFRRTGGFISTGHVGSGHASYDEAAFITDLLGRYDDAWYVLNSLALNPLLTKKARKWQIRILKKEKKDFSHIQQLLDNDQ